jgi:hypothetical protein
MKRRVLQLLASGYLALYLAGIVVGLFQREMSFSDTGDLLVMLMFLLIMAGCLISWFHEYAGGIILQIWNILIWILSLFVWTDDGMVLVLAFPVLVIGVLLNLNAYKKSEGERKAVYLKWKFVLRRLIVNYTILYFIMVLYDMLAENVPDLTSLPFIIFPVLLTIYLAGFILSWRKELPAGILFVVWYLIVVAGTILYPEFGNNGPYILFGFPIFLQGLFYIRLTIKRL